jgi:cell division septal protein FtsQ
VKAKGRDARAVPRGASPATPHVASSPRPRAGGRAAARQRRSTGSHARRTGPRLRAPRLRLPGGGRIGAALLAALFAAALVYLVDGPWLRISSVAWAGTRYADPDELSAILTPLRGTSLLALDSRLLSARLRGLPAVAEADVEPQLPGGVSVTVQEKTPAVIWQTNAVRLLVARDGVVFGEIALSAKLPAQVAGLPLVDDRRRSSHDLNPGDRIPADERSLALRLDTLDPALLGSRATSLDVRIDERCGYVVSPSKGGWSAAFGMYGPSAGDASPADIDAQVAAVRTLFAAHRENTIGWVDVRNPGKVYWRPNGPGGSNAC